MESVQCATWRLKHLWHCLSLAVGLWVATGSQPVQAQVGGVYIDPTGLLRETSALSPQELRDQLARDNPGEHAAGAVSRRSPLRKVSLRRLEQTVARMRQQGQALPADCRFLAGLTSIRYVLLYPETNDVVLAGPAEGWNRLTSGDYVGSDSQQPVLQLEDLIVALRYAFANHEPGSFLGCSIEPTAQGVRAHADFVRRLSGMDGSKVDEVVDGLEQSVGLQDIHVYGIEPASRFAWQMVAADYRLKRISLAHDPSPVAKLPSYLDLAEKTVNAGPQRQHRWWFVGHYDAIRHTPDRLAFALEGSGLTVATAPTSPPGSTAKPAERPTRSAKQFADLATKHMVELIEKVPAIAELKNLVGLAVAATLIRQQADRERAEATEPAAESTEPAPAGRGLRTWRPGHFLDDEKCPITRLAVPKQTPSLANVRYVQNQYWLFSVSGGVEVDPRRMTDADHLQPAVGAKLNDTRGSAAPPNQADRWWWD
ncbi:MAG: DUF1598 domain-containing protein [Planctomycetes bacterium]|nr:DUF1598 domain-containing protein [Planctomycetota bacterium]